MITYLNVFALTLLQQDAARQSVFGSNPACVHDEFEKHARSKKTTSPVRFLYPDSPTLLTPTFSSILWECQALSNALIGSQRLRYEWAGMGVSVACCGLKGTTEAPFCCCAGNHIWSTGCTVLRYEWLRWTHQTNIWPRFDLADVGQLIMSHSTMLYKGVRDRRWAHMIIGEMSILLSNRNTIAFFGDRCIFHACVKIKISIPK